MTETAGVTPRIDVHYHILPPRYLALPGVYQAFVGALIPLVGPDAAHRIVDGWTPANAIDEMDRSDIATGLCSVGGRGVDGLGDTTLDRRAAREWNEYAAKLGQDHPRRFGFFATIPLTDTDGSLAEIVHAFDALEADGIALLTSYGDKWLGDPAFTTIFEELDRRKAVVFIHPTVPACCRGILSSYAPYLMEVPTDTTRAILNIIFTGTLLKFPNIRFIFSHAGGTITALAGRIALYSDDRKDLVDRIPKGFRAEMAKLYYDTASAADPASLGALAQLIPVSHILFGSDYPFSPIPVTVAGLRRLGLAGTDIKEIERGNAQRLLPRWDDVR